MERESLCTETSSFKLKDQALSTFPGARYCTDLCDRLMGIVQSSILEDRGGATSFVARILILTGKGISFFISVYFKKRNISLTKVCTKACIFGRSRGGTAAHSVIAAAASLVSVVRDASPVTQRGRDLSLSSGGASEGRCFSEACLVEHPKTIGRPPAETPRFGAEGDGPLVADGWVWGFG